MPAEKMTAVFQQKTKCQEEYHMEFAKLIEERRSCRKYAPSAEEVPAADIIRDAQMAPSWKNSQTARCYVSKELSQFLPEYNRDNTKDCRTYVLTTYIKGISGNGENDKWSAYDLGLHDAYLVLAAKNRGYDTLIMGMRDEKGLREFFNIPENEEIMSVIAIGHAGCDMIFRERKPLSEVMTEN